MYFVYILICSDNSLYTGSTNNLQKRINTHNTARGAKYTKNRLPVVLKKYFICENKSQALKLEYRIKKLPRRIKNLL